MKTTTFESAKVGDRVWSAMRGFGTVSEVQDHEYFPLKVHYDLGTFDTYTFKGAVYSGGLQVLFWDEIKFEVPSKPLPDLVVDTKVLVWGNNNIKHRRHFSHFSHGRIYTFDSGSTSFTMLHSNSVTGWPNWELAESLD